MCVRVFQLGTHTHTHTAIPESVQHSNECGGDGTLILWIGLDWAPESCRLSPSICATLGTICDDNHKAFLQVPSPSGSATNKLPSFEIPKKFKFMPIICSKLEMHQKLGHKFKYRRSQFYSILFWSCLLSGNIHVCFEN